MTKGRPRVAVATRIFLPEAAAASFRLSALASALAGEGAAVSVITTTVPGDDSVPFDERVMIRRWPALRDKAGYIRGYVQYMSFDLPLFFRLLFGPRVDAVVSEPPPTTGVVVRLACAVRRAPYVYYAADVWSDASASMGASGLVVRVLRTLESFAMRGAQRVIAVSDGVAERVAALGGRNITVIRNGIDTAVFRPLDEVVDSQPTAVYAGTASEWQGASVFARAFAQVRVAVPGARLVFIGQGSELDEIRRIAASLPDGAIEVRGPVPPAHAAEILGSARAGLVSLRPGLGYDFAFPTKILASVACGTPVVFAGPGPGYEAVLDGDLGWATDYDDNAVAAAMIEALSDAPTRERRAELAAWAAANASVQATGARAAQVVLESRRLRT
ncbi:glycosyltransferase family 4 protein [Xylanimonas protaetiae]|uniref:D-inositol 3-phosphate glycosyltransferase n=1 Tax=Xylanimonas protaetiae TaxID=2509457 RepID=A0A4V0YFU4_9MICO|nr:glycosyltransferase family 4 protein [Xylanimonas protaetiae]QAY68921.1 glycosyltransferase WbuB [Xylanimonas protaetiae]